MKMNLIILCSFFFFRIISFSQIQGEGGIPKSLKTVDLSQLETTHFSEPDIKHLREEDAVNDLEKRGPWRFGYNNDTWLNMENSGKWFDLSNGGKVWMIRLKCEKALTVNLTFENLVLTEGNELYVYNDDKSFILGKFKDYHVYRGQLGTELIPGETAIVEYYVAPTNIGKPVSLTIDKVTHGYRTTGEYVEKTFGESANCNMNVNCPDGAGWENQKRSVVMLVSGSNGFCTGAMINNTANDGKPYVLTANHCGSNPTNWVFRFNWESANCSNPGSSPSFQSLSGATLRARRTPSDFSLVEITGGLQSGTVPASYNTYFSGWDNSGDVPTTTVGIHHPSGDIKKISFDDQPAVVVQAMSSTEANSSWEVVWNRNTTTEGGSSGSPLFNQDQKIIGQLWGGNASCSNLSGKDWYGRLSMSWEPAGSNSTNQLKYWLDPSNSGATILEGYDPNAPTVNDDAGIQSVTQPIGSYCETTITPSVVLKNYGANTLTSVAILYEATGVAQQTYNWTGNLASGASTTVTLPTMTVNSGSSTFTVQTSMPNGVADNNNGNDLKITSFTAIANALPVSVSISTDCYGYETYWRIVDGSSNVVLSGGNITVALPGGTRNANQNGSGAYGNATTILAESCLAGGCYTFEIYDDWGDGLSTTTNPLAGCSTNSNNYSVTGDGTIVVTMGAANFGNNEFHTFCIGASVGIEDKNAVKQDFSIYPNPTSGLFTVEFPQNMNEEYTISVMDLTGRIIYETTDSKLKKMINLEGLSTGKYIITVKTATVLKNQSLLIK
jgi:lysyl endopeptidase